MILETTTIGLALVAVAEYTRSRRGPLVLLSIGILHTRAALLCARRELARVPERWRQQYPMAVCDVRRQI